MYYLFDLKLVSKHSENINPKNTLMNIIPNAAYGALCTTSLKLPPNTHTTDGRIE
jgi:hypothetical protein